MRSAGATTATAAAANEPSRLRRARNIVWSVPVGLQLSIVYTLISAVTLALLGWALYAQLEGFLVQNTAQRLDKLTHPILVRSFQPGQFGGDTGIGGVPGFQDGPPVGQGSSEDQAISSLVHQLSGPDSTVAVLDAQAQVINSTQPFSNDTPIVIPALPADWAQKIVSGTVTGAVQWIVSVPGSERQLVVLTPITLTSSDGSGSEPTRTQLYLEQIASLGAADAVLSQLQLYIALGILVGTVIGVLAGLALTRTILHPLERMVRTAEAIADGDLDRRLRLPAGRNEVARLGSAFDHMVDRLGSALDAQKRFVADASHELRTPLTSLEGLSEMLLMGADNGNVSVVQRTVRAMHGELARLGRLVADLLILSRLDSTTPGRFVPADVQQVLGEVAQQMEPTAAGRCVTLTMQCDVSLQVNGEPDKLKQIVLNLTDNALRYTPEGGEVVLSAGLDATGKYVRIRVQDTGSGIPEEDVPYIFDRFYRGDLSRTRSTGNSGLGLAIVHGIVVAHGGTITVQSKQGEGTCFTILLPTLMPAPVTTVVPGKGSAQEKALPVAG